MDIGVDRDEVPGQQGQRQRREKDEQSYCRKNVEGRGDDPICGARVLVSQCLCNLILDSAADTEIQHAVIAEDGSDQRPVTVDPVAKPVHQERHQKQSNHRRRNKTCYAKNGAHQCEAMSFQGSLLSYSRGF